MGEVTSWVDNGVVDTTINEFFGHYDGDEIKDYWAEVTQYDPTWSTPFYYSAYSGFNSYIPFNYRELERGQSRMALV